MLLICLGPEPPPYSGTTVSYALLVEELERAGALKSVKSFDLQASKTASRASKLMHSLGLLGATWRQLFAYDMVLLNASNARAIVMGFMLDLVCSMHRKPLVVRIFGGAFMEHYRQAPKWRKWMARRVLKRRPVLLQTQYSMQRVREAFPQADLRWFPNSRPLSQSGKDGADEESTTASPLRCYFAGNICEQKGVDLLLDLARDYRGPRIEMHLFGELLDDFKPERLEAAGSADCEVAYHGVIPSEALSRQIRDFDVLLFPTRFVGEGHPGVILEAFASGIPVLASDWYAIPELVDENSGMLLPHDDPDCWIQAVQKLAESPDRLRALSNGARARSREFDSAYWNRERMPELLESILEKGAGR